MLEGYCVRCKDKRPIHDAMEVVMKNGRKAFKGRCPTCGGGMFKIVGGKSPGGGFPETSTPVDVAVLAEAAPAAVETPVVPPPATDLPV